MILLVGALVVLVVTEIITDSYLFRPVRALATRVSPHAGVLFGCFLCMGTWVGFGVGWALPGPAGTWWLDGLAYHGLALLAHAVLELVGDLRTRLQR